MACARQGLISRGYSYTLQKNHGESWDLTDSAGHKLTAPAVCFMIPPTDPEALALADRYEATGEAAPLLCAHCPSPTPRLLARGLWGCMGTSVVRQPIPAVRQAGRSVQGAKGPLGERQEGAVARPELEASSSLLASAPTSQGNLRAGGAVGCWGPSRALFCSLASQYRAVRQKAAGSRSALQQRHEVLKTQHPGGGSWQGGRLACEGGAGLLLMAQHHFLQMLQICRGGSCWLAWTRWPVTWTGRRRPSQGSCGHHWSKAALCRTVPSGPRPSRYPGQEAQGRRPCP